MDVAKLLLDGGSVIDWPGLQLEEGEIRDFICSQGLDLSCEGDRQWIEDIKWKALRLVRVRLDFPIPRPVREAGLHALLRMASGSGHRRTCACALLKVMHIIHHVESRAQAQDLPVVERDLFALVEQKVHATVGHMFAAGMPVTSISGGRKDPTSVYLKLLSRRETLAAQVYDKLRFRIITRTNGDVMTVVGHLQRHLFPFNYVVPGQSTNTLMEQPVGDAVEVGSAGVGGNAFRSADYRCLSFAVDMPVRLPAGLLQQVSKSRVRSPVAFVQVEFQVLDEASDQANQRGDACHDAYKARQLATVARRLDIFPDLSILATRPAHDGTDTI